MSRELLIELFIFSFFFTIDPLMHSVYPETGLLNRRDDLAPMMLSFRLCPGIVVLRFPLDVIAGYF